MFLAYIDEIGETGAFVARDHARFNTSPAFGYAGFLIPANAARAFGSVFTREKRALFKTEIEQAEHPGRWERKGASIFRPDTHKSYPQQIRVFNALVRQLRDCGGVLFYYANEKPIGTPKQTSLDTDARESAAMREALNRLARHANRGDHNLLVMIDQVNEKTRAQRLPIMYSHILGRAGDFPEMKRIIEPPMHVDSALSSNIQFADWIAACVTRAIDYQLTKDSPYQWVTAAGRIPDIKGSFSFESKLHLHQRACPDVNHSEVFQSERRLYPVVTGQLLGEGSLAVRLRIMKAAAERSAARERERQRTPVKEALQGELDGTA